MIKGIGTDIVDLKRLEKKDDRFVKHVLSDEEYKLYEMINNDTRKLTFLGGRFAAKEALSKAISKSSVHLNFKDFVILNDESGKPYLHASPDILKGVSVHLSIAHTELYALAYVILEIS